MSELDEEVARLREAERIKRHAATWWEDYGLIRPPSNIDFVRPTPEEWVDLAVEFMRRTTHSLPDSIAPFWDGRLCMLGVGVDREGVERVRSVTFFLDGDMESPPSSRLVVVGDGTRIAGSVVSRATFVSLAARSLAG